MSFKLPFKSKDTVTEYVTVTDETECNELTLPIRPFSYKDMAWFKENAESFNDEANQEEGYFKLAEYYLRSRLEVPVEVSRDDLFRYESGEPFSLIFVMRLAESFSKQIDISNKKVEAMVNDKTESIVQSKRNSKSSGKGVQKDG